MADNTRFSGRVAVVTGGASGIGFAAVQRFLNEGGQVSVWDRDAHALAALGEKLGKPVHTIALDIVDPEAVKRAADDTAKALGKIDILVASAGIAGPNHLVADYPIEDWKRVFDINVHGLFYCNRYVVPHMIANGYGRIVNISSVAGKEGNPTASAYSASKAAVIGLTKSLGKELAKTNIRVNCVTPATARTPILDQVSQAHIDYMISRIPIGRVGEPEEVAAMICWLSSEEVSFSTAATFDISGGRCTY
jgi:2-dehydro-3-deoxy-L-rhamnonate dehydrogenase (NAD+)